MFMNHPAPRIIADEMVARVNDGLRPPPPDWGSRALYPSPLSAKNWLTIAGDPNHIQLPADPHGLESLHALAVRDVSVGTLVSLGPGDGLTDARLVRSLRPDAKGGDVPRLRYIPVDISRLLLETAVANLASLADIPAGVLCDFEAQPDFLADAVARYRDGPVLFALLGGTVGNLDGHEAPFFDGVRRMMRPIDLFLVELPLAGPAWLPETEPRLRADGYSEACRRFFLEGLGRATSDGEPNARVDDDFARGVILSHDRDAETGAEVIIATNRSTGRAARNRRHRWDPIQRWLKKQGFAVLFARSSLTTDEDRFGMGVVLLTPRESLGGRPGSDRAEVP